MIDRWPILNNPVNDRIVSDQKVPQVMIDSADVQVPRLRVARVPEYFKDQVLRSQLAHLIGTSILLG